MFPIRIFNIQRFSDLSNLFFKTKNNQTWYEVDLIVLSIDKVEFEIFDLDARHGIRGKKTHSYSVSVNAYDYPNIKAAIDGELYDLAKNRRLAEIEEEENRIMEQYIEEERKKLGL